MISHHSKIYIAVTVIIVAVILLGIGIFNLVSSGKKSPVSEPEEKVEQGVNYRHPLSGQPVEAPVENFFAVAIMFDNAYDSRPQYGLDQADIVYEALAEGNITRIMGIFDSQKNIEKIGPVRSARLYFMDMAGEYGGVYMHVGGAPNALAKRGAYSFSDVDQIGAGEIYFWRDNDLSAPHNVFTSSANWLRAGDIKEVPKFSINRNWNFTVGENATITDLTIDYNGPYKVDWKYNDKLGAYMRWQGDDKFIYHTGEQVRAENVIVQVLSSKIVDNKDRREMDTQSGGQVFIFNKLGQQNGRWEIVDGRTLFFDENKNELKLAPGRSWVQIIPAADYLISR
ncbi:MAG: hypothetical protein A2611_03455 [Candidatus Komeilibacteria bacterium RIFOXYD1_FULL_37_29]|nr:MAG: hypothetical protein A2611_03455 [Candidatus Komeilibacteria bacterium RIFOXYD1_FULL_37_29]